MVCFRHTTINIMLQGDNEDNDDDDDDDKGSMLYYVYQSKTG